MEKKQLQRLPSGCPYATGDDNFWTYEYTWEDYVATRSVIEAEHRSEIYELKSDIIAYFRESPEKLLGQGIYKDYSLDDIKLMLERGSTIILS